MEAVQNVLRVLERPLGQVAMIPVEIGIGVAVTAIFTSTPFLIGGAIVTTLAIADRLFVSVMRDFNIHLDKIHLVLYRCLITYIVAETFSIATGITLGTTLFISVVSGLTFLGLVFSVLAVAYAVGRFGQPNPNPPPNLIPAPNHNPAPHNQNLNLNLVEN